MKFCWTNNERSKKIKNTDKNNDKNISKEKKDWQKRVSDNYYDILPLQTSLDCNVNFCLFFLICWLQILDTGKKWSILERWQKRSRWATFGHSYTSSISIRREGALKLLLQLNKHLARRTIIRTNSFCFIFRSGLEEVYCQLSQGEISYWFRYEFAFPFPNLKNPNTKNVPEGKRNMREISGTSLKNSHWLLRSLRAVLFFFLNEFRLWIHAAERVHQKWPPRVRNSSHQNEGQRQRPFFLPLRWVIRKC